MVLFPVVVGLYADEDHVIHVVGTAAVAADASRAGIERPHGEVTVVRATPAPVDVEPVAVVIAVEDKAVAS